MEVAAFDSGRLAENVQEEEWLGATLYIFVGEKMFGGLSYNGAPQCTFWAPLCANGRDVTPVNSRTVQRGLPFSGRRIGCAPMVPIALSIRHIVHWWHIDLDFYAQTVTRPSICV